MVNSSLAIPLRSGINYAPIKPLLSLKESKPKEHYLCSALKERWGHYWGIEKPTWQQMIRTGAFTARMLEGDQLLVPNPWTNGWLVIKPPREDDQTERALNLMQFYVTNCITKDLLSNPDIVVRPGRDTDESSESSKAGGIIVDHYEEKFFDPWFNIQSTLLKLTFGTSITRLRYDAGIKGAVALREVVENQSVTMGEGEAWCGDCGRGGTATEFQGQIESEMGPEMAEMCPHCGSSAVMANSAASMEMPVVVGQEEIQLGDLCLDELPFPYCRWDLHERPETSSWFLYQRRASIGVIRRMLGRVNLAGGSGEIDLGMDVARALAYTGLPIDGKGKRRQQKFMNAEEFNLCEMWLSPEDCADIVIKGDEETVASANGEAPPLPVGATLADLFPEGAFALGANGMSTVFGVYSEKHSDCISSSVWFAKPMSGAGRGGQDMVEVQKRINKLDSQQLDFMDAAATPATLAIQGIVDQDQAGYLGRPRANIFVDLAKLPEGKGIMDCVGQLSPQSTPGSMVQYVQQFLTQAFSTTSHVTDFSNGGLMAQRNDTARGAAIADANANSVMAPMLAMKALHRRRIAEQVVNYYRQYFPIERYFPLSGKFSQQQGVYLSGANLCSDLRYEVVRESELPQNSESKQQRTLNFFALFGGFPIYMEARAQNPALVASLARLWNVKLEDDGDYDQTAQLARRRLEQMKAALGQGQQQMAAMGMQPMPANPMMLIAAIQPPISIVEPDMPGMMTWFRQWMVTDEGLAAPMELRAAVEMLVQGLFQGAGLQQGVMASQQAEVQSAGTPPGQEPDGDEGQGPPQEKKAA